MVMTDEHVRMGEEKMEELLREAKRAIRGADVREPVEPRSEADAWANVVTKWVGLAETAVAKKCIADVTYAKAFLEAPGAVKDREAMAEIGAGRARLEADLARVAEQAMRYVVEREVRGGAR